MAILRSPGTRTGGQRPGNTRDYVRVTSDQKIGNHFDYMAASNFKLLKRFVDDEQFGRLLMGRLFERF